MSACKFPKTAPQGDDNTLVAALNYYINTSHTTNELIIRNLISKFCCPVALFVVGGGGSSSASLSLSFSRLSSVGNRSHCVPLANTNRHAHTIGIDGGASLDQSKRL